MMLGGGQPNGDVEGQPKGLDRFDNLAPLAAGIELAQAITHKWLAYAVV